MVDRGNTLLKNKFLLLFFLSLLLLGSYLFLFLAENTGGDQKGYPLFTEAAEGANGVQFRYKCDINAPYPYCVKVQEEGQDECKPEALPGQLGSCLVYKCARGIGPEGVKCLLYFEPRGISTCFPEFNFGSIGSCGFYDCQEPVYPREYLENVKLVPPWWALYSDLDLRKELGKIECRVRPTMGIPENEGIENFGNKCNPNLNNGQNPESCFLYKCRVNEPADPNQKNVYCLPTPRDFPSAGGECNPQAEIGKPGSCAHYGCGGIERDTEQRDTKCILFSKFVWSEVSNYCSPEAEKIGGNINSCFYYDCLTWPEGGKYKVGCRRVPKNPREVKSNSCDPRLDNQENADQLDSCWTTQCELKDDNTAQCKAKNIFDSRDEVLRWMGVKECKFVKPGEGGDCNVYACVNEDGSIPDPSILEGRQGNNPVKCALVAKKIVQNKKLKTGCTLDGNKNENVGKPGSCAYYACKNENLKHYLISQEGIINGVFIGAKIINEIKEDVETSFCKFYPKEPSRNVTNHCDPNDPKNNCHRGVCGVMEFRRGLEGFYYYRRCLPVEGEGKDECSPMEIGEGFGDAFTWSACTLEKCVKDESGGIQCKPKIRRVFENRDRAFSPEHVCALDADGNDAGKDLPAGCYYYECDTNRNCVQKPRFSNTPAPTEGSYYNDDQFLSKKNVKAQSTCDPNAQPGKEGSCAVYACVNEDGSIPEGKPGDNPVKCAEVSKAVFKEKQLKKCKLDAQPGQEGSCAVYACVNEDGSIPSGTSEDNPVKCGLVAKDIFTNPNSNLKSCNPKASLGEKGSCAYGSCFSQDFSQYRRLKQFRGKENAGTFVGIKINEQIEEDFKISVCKLVHKSPDIEFPTNCDPADPKKDCSHGVCGVFEINNNTYVRRCLPVEGEGEDSCSPAEVEEFGIDSNTYVNWSACAVEKCVLNDQGQTYCKDKIRQFFSNKDRAFNPTKICDPQAPPDSDGVERGCVGYFCLTDGECKKTKRWTPIRKIEEETYADDQIGTLIGDKDISKKPSNCRPNAPIGTQESCKVYSCVNEDGSIPSGTSDDNPVKCMAVPKDKGRLLNSCNPNARPGEIGSCADYGCVNEDGSLPAGTSEDNPVKCGLVAKYILENPYSGLKKCDPNAMLGKKGSCGHYKCVDSPLSDYIAKRDYNSEKLYAYTGPLYTSDCKPVAHDPNQPKASTCNPEIPSKDCKYYDCVPLKFSPPLFSSSIYLRGCVPIKASFNAAGQENEKDKCSSAEENIALPQQVSCRVEKCVKTREGKFICKDKVRNTFRTPEEASNPPKVCLVSNEESDDPDNGCVRYECEGFNCKKKPRFEDTPDEDADLASLLAHVDPGSKNRLSSECNPNARPGEIGSCSKWVCEQQVVGGPPVCKKVAKKPDKEEISENTRVCKNEGDRCGYLGCFAGKCRVEDTKPDFPCTKSTYNPQTGQYDLSNECIHYECRPYEGRVSQGWASSWLTLEEEKRATPYVCAPILLPGESTCDPNIDQTIWQRQGAFQVLTKLTPDPLKAGSCYATMCDFQEESPGEGETTLRAECKIFPKPTKGLSPWAQCRPAAKEGEQGSCIIGVCKQKSDEQGNTIYSCEPTRSLDKDKGSECRIGSKPGEESACSHYECRGNKCVEVSGQGENQCDPKQDSGEEACKHYECVDEEGRGVCQLKNGQGKNQCNPENKGLECNRCKGGECVFKGSEGVAENAPRCVPGAKPGERNPQTGEFLSCTHYVCEDLRTCKEQEGQGLNECEPMGIPGNPASCAHYACSHEGKCKLFKGGLPRKFAERFGVKGLCGPVDGQNNCLRKGCEGLGCIQKSIAEWKGGCRLRDSCRWNTDCCRSESAEGKLINAIKRALEGLNAKGCGKSDFGFLDLSDEEIRRAIQSIAECQFKALDIEIRGQVSSPLEPNYYNFYNWYFGVNVGYFDYVAHINCMDESCAIACYSCMVSIGGEPLARSGGYPVGGPRSDPTDFIIIFQVPPFALADFLMKEFGFWWSSVWVGDMWVPECDCPEIRINSADMWVPECYRPEIRINSADVRLVNWSEGEGGSGEWSYDECASDSDCPQPPRLTCFNRGKGEGKEEVHWIVMNYYKCEPEDPQNLSSRKVCKLYDENYFKNLTDEEILLGKFEDIVIQDCGKTSKVEYCDGDYIRSRTFKNWCSYKGECGEIPKCASGFTSSSRRCGCHLPSAPPFFVCGGPPSYITQFCENCALSNDPETCRKLMGCDQQWIHQVFICDTCGQTPEGKLGCVPAGIRTMPAFPCPVPQNISKTVCTPNPGGPPLRCTITVRNEGRCLIKDGWMPTCSPFEVDFKCNGYCEGGEDEARCDEEGRCTPFGTRDPCKNASDCPKECNEQRRCVAYGGGSPCEDDSDCLEGGGRGDWRHLLRCNEFNKCVIGGKGKRCTSWRDCIESEKRCDANRRCVQNGGGIACDSDDECQNPDLILSCNRYDQCVPGGGDKECVNDNECRESKTRCYFSGECVEVTTENRMFTGIACGPEITCLESNFECNYWRKCVPGGGGVPCTKDEDCQNLSFECNPKQQCVRGGGGIPCTTDKDCQNLEPQCNYWRQCVSGGGGALCTKDDDCQNLEPQCNYWGQCRPGGGGVPCRNDEDCGKGVSLILSVVENPQYSCYVEGVGLVHISWIFNSSAPQAGYHLQISEDSNFTKLVVDHQGETERSHMIFVRTQFSPLEGGNSIEYNKSYYIRLRVRDTEGKEIGWIYYDSKKGTFNQRDAKAYKYPYSHPLPYPFFLSVEKAKVNESISFSDLSKCYISRGDAIEKFYCNQLLSTTYRWRFGDNETSSKKGSVNHSYKEEGSYYSTLTVCDELGCCTVGKPIEIEGGEELELPQWREISPF